MKPFEGKDYKVFDMFNNDWALVTAGTSDHFNTCTIGWGSLGTIWGSPCRGKPIVTVYVNPARYTWQFLKESSTFSVSFFPKEYKRALGYLGSHSGRNEDKISAAGLHPVFIDQGITYEEAELTLFCQKLYQARFEKDGMNEEIREFYNNGNRHFDGPHWMFIGEVTDMEDKR